jgi:hypothetical protein
VIAKGLSAAKLVLVFISDEYSESDNCRMEFQFALKSLKKKVVPIVVGTGDKWNNTIIGMLVNGCDVATIDMRGIDGSEYEEKLQEIIQYCGVVQDASYQSKCDGTPKDLVRCCFILLNCFFHFQII